MRYLKEFLSSVLAGICIALGGMVYLICVSKGQQILGSYLFSVGLLLILVFSFHLYTGKIGYVFDNKPKYLLDLLIIFIGNFVGSLIYGYGLSLTRLGNDIKQNAIDVTNAKLGDNLGSILILSIICGFLVYVAVASWKNDKIPGVARFMMVVLCIGSFVACGLEHVVANMFYFSLANMWSWKALGYIMMMALGNSLGSFIVPLFQKIKVKEE